MLTQFPPGGFPGSLAIFLYSSTSSERNHGGGRETEPRRERGYGRSKRRRFGSNRLTRIMTVIEIIHIRLELRRFEFIWGLSHGATLAQDHMPFVSQARTHTHTHTLT